MPGVTAIDTAAIVRAKEPIAKPRNRLLSWISGDYGDDTTSGVDAAALAPPDDEVRREMFRLELEAEVANLQAEADALMADASVEGGVLVTVPIGTAAATEGTDAAAARAADADSELAEPGEPTDDEPAEPTDDEARPV